MTEIEITDEMVEAYVTAYANAYRRRIVDNVLPSERNEIAVRAGLAAALETIGLPPEFHPVKAPAAVAKLYVLAALNEMATALHQARAKYTADLSGDEPFKLLLAAEEYAQRREGEKS